MSDNPAITPKPNGPLFVTDLERLVNSKGTQLPVEGKMALCRCGHSNNKPFCDGSHKAHGFTGENEAQGAGDGQQSYAGKSITIHDNRAICAHAGECTAGLPDVWRMGQEPWIDADGAAVAEIVRVIGRCPSGALSYTLSDGATPAPASGAQILVSENGPYQVTGAIACVDVSWGEGADRTRYTLCRCGASKNKPFCDGSHWDAGFRDENN